jgi:hypothetical protein
MRLYPIGTFFKNEEETIVQLTQIEAGIVNFISLKDGNRWFNSWVAADPNKVDISGHTEDFLKHTWTPIKVNFYVVGEDLEVGEETNNG